RLARACLVALCAVLTLATVPTAAHAQFGLASLSTTSSTSQAGAHPDLTLAFALNREALGDPVGQLRRATLTLPPGLLGNAQAMASCDTEAFQEYRCPTDSQVGVLNAAFVACQGIDTSLQAEAQAGDEVLTLASTNGLC